MLRAAARAVVVAMLATSGVATTVWAERLPEFTSSGFGPNVFIIDPTWSTSQIKAKFDAILAQQVDNEFGTQRYQFLFMPGTYGTPTDPLKIQLGYYTSVAGLGASPNDVVINGTINVYNRCLRPEDCTALVNFWRSVENLALKVTGQNDLWATSQAAPMRRVRVTGDLFLFDYQSQPGYASGGFIADSVVDGKIINGSQQQFMTRNSEITAGWSNGVWNQVFSGVTGAPPQSFSTTPFNPPPYTTLPTSPVTREKPFLRVDSTGEYQVFVPAVQRNSAGTTWANGPTAGRSISIDRFFVAQPTDSASTINRALARGKHLLLTPGIYHLDRTLEITHPQSIVLGLGYATLVPDTGNVAMTVVDTNGADVAGLMIDAGPLNSAALLKVGLRPDRTDRDTGRDADAGAAPDPGAPDPAAHDPAAHGHDSAEPSGLQDVFFRIGGATPGRATNSLIVNADNVILDDIWAWRADHGNGVGWTQNVADTGLIVNGDSVIAYGLFVEHYQKYQVIWKGEKGRTIMFQNEMPYDPPDQAAWSHDGIAGWAAFKVADSVQLFEGWGLGSYAFFNVNPSVHADHAFEVPVRQGVKLHDLLTVSLDGVSVIDHVVNEFGPPTNKTPGTPVNVVSYPPAP